MDEGSGPAALCHRILAGACVSVCTRVCVHSFPGAAVTNDPKLGGLKQWILSVWRPEVRNQGVNKAVLPQKALGEEGPFRPLPASGGYRCPLAVAASLQPVPLTSRGLLLVRVKPASAPFLQGHL